MGLKDQTWRVLSPSVLSAANGLSLSPFLPPIKRSNDQTMKETKEKEGMEQKGIVFADQKRFGWNPVSVCGDQTHRQKESINHGERFVFTSLLQTAASIRLSQLLVHAEHRKTAKGQISRLVAFGLFPHLFTQLFRRPRRSSLRPRDLPHLCLALRPFPSSLSIQPRRTIVETAIETATRCSRDVYCVL